MNITGPHMTDQLDLLKLVARRLEEAGIPYMLTGSLALSYYAEPRFTRDIDLVVRLAPQDVERTASLFAPDFYADAGAIRAAVKRRGMANLIHQETLIKVDLIVQKATSYHLGEFARRRSVVIDGAHLWIVSPEDLVLSKLSWLKQGGSDIHRRDVEAVLASPIALDRDYIETAAHELDVVGLWKALTL